MGDSSLRSFRSRSRSSVPSGVRTSCLARRSEGWERRSISADSRACRPRRSRSTARSPSARPARPCPSDPSARAARWPLPPLNCETTCTASPSCSAATTASHSSSPPSHNPGRRHPRAAHPGTKETRRPPLPCRGTSRPARFRSHATGQRTRSGATRSTPGGPKQVRISTHHHSQPGARTTSKRSRWSQD
jgi:hypothetical protein